MPLIPPDNILMLGGVMFGLAAFGYWADNHRIARKLSGVVFVLTTGLILSNVGITPLSSPVYDFTGGYLVPLAIPLLLYKANLRNVLRESGVVLTIFLLGALAICFAAVVGYFLFDLGEIGKKIAAIYTGAWIGGVVNFIAVSQALELTPEQFGVAIGASAPVSVLGLIALVTLPVVPFVLRHIPSRIMADVAAGDPSLQQQAAVSFRGLHITGAIALSFAICSISTIIANRLSIANYTIFVITIITVVLVNMAPRFFAKFEGDFDLGMMIMYLFFAVVGCSTDALSFLTEAPIYFVFGIFIIGTHLVLLLLCAKMFKFDLAETIIGSAAAIVGAAPAAAIAASNGWKHLVTPGITVGILGYVIANFIALGLYKLLML